MNRVVFSLVGAARVPDTLPETSFGLWTIKRHSIRRATWGSAINIWFAGTDRFVALHRLTYGTMHSPPGEVVMEDTPRELRRHVPIWLAARGRVLVTGLGLGCVVRGLLALPRVDHVDVVEIDPDVLRIVGAEFAANPRVSLHHGNALRYKWPRAARWDFAWHDLWCENGSLDSLHVKLMLRMRGKVGRQGAWGLHREIKRFLPADTLGVPRRRPVLGRS